MSSNSESTTNPKVLKVLKTSSSCSPSPSEQSISSEHKKWAEEAYCAFEYALFRAPKEFRTIRGPAKETFVSLYAERSKEGTAIKWLKFHSSYLFAYAVGQDELPAPPGPSNERPGCFCEGQVSHICRSIMARARPGSWPWRRIAYDILMMKLGCPRAPQSFIDDTYRDHLKALTQSREIDCEIQEQVEEKIDQICDSVFRRKVLKPRTFMPSLSSCYEVSLRAGGQLGHLWSLVRDFIHGPRLSYLSSMVNIRECVYDLHLPDPSDLIEELHRRVDLVILDRRNEPLHVIPEPIREPLKVRMITKGEAACYYRCIDLQKFMHGELKRQKPFQYIGQPIDDQSWRKCFGCREDLPEDKFYVSGDYRAATDNLNPYLSEYVWKAICCRARNRDGQPLYLTHYYELGKKALTGHMVHYPARIVGAELAERGIQQTWGQLMGSPMSFPVLCIVNLAATLAALDSDYSEDLPIKVNGDDIGFIATKSQYERWKVVTKECGLEFSLGKNYLSKDFLLMNSELRRPPGPGTITKEVEDDELTFSEEDDSYKRGTHPEVLDRPWRLEGFVNQSILRSREKKGLHAGEHCYRTWTELESLSSALLGPLDRGERNGTSRRVLMEFLRNHQDVLKCAPYGCQKFFPRNLGGMGIYVPRGEELKDLLDTDTSRSQKIAAYLHCYPAKRVNRPTVSNSIGGGFGESLKDLRLSVNLPRVLRQKPLHRENVPVVGGSYLLAALLLTPSPEDQADGWIVRPEGQKAQRANHQRLLHQWLRWTRPARACGLSPMNLENIHGFRDHLESYSYVDTLHIDVCREIVV